MKAHNAETKKKGKESEALIKAYKEEQVVVQQVRPLPSGEPDPDPGPDPYRCLDPDS